jgi:sucrose-6-phosphate hydrolase SacC (GH32 family)
MDIFSPLFFIVSAFIILIICAIICEIFLGRGIPFIHRQAKWSVGIYIGNNPFELASPKDIKNPVLTAKQVTDVPAAFIADPFMVKENETWYMFFEVVNKDSEQGEIGLAVSKNGMNWQYKQIVLNEAFSLSYPYVFKWEGKYYMIPESNQAESVRLYKADDFPIRWSLEKLLLTGDNYRDPSIFYLNNHWWLFTCTSKNHDVLRLYYADSLLGKWLEHPKSPLIEGNAHIARPGGRVLIFNNHAFRFAQDCEPNYGNQVRAFEITELSVSNYEEREVPYNPILKASGRGWNKGGMHQIDLHNIDVNEWIACVDGCRPGWVFISRKIKKLLDLIV